MTTLRSIQSSKVSDFFSIMFWLFLWEISSQTKLISPELFSSPSEIFKNLFQSLIGLDFYIKYLIPSLNRFLVACVLAIPLAYVAGVVLALSGFMRTLLYPVISALFPLPKVALFPLILVLFGTGDLSKIFLIFLSMFFIFFIGVYQATLKIHQDMYGDLIKTLPHQNFKTYYQIYFKGSWLGFLTSARTAMSYGLTMIVVSEISMSNNGLGYYIWSSWEQYNIVGIYSGLFLIGLSGLLLGALVDLLIKQARPRY